jgi:OOP family OmpA-OmpF porin
MKKMVLFMLVAFAAMQTAAFAENKAETFTLSPFVGGYTYKVDKDKFGALETSVIYGLRGGYNFTRNLGAELVFHYASAESFDSSRERVDVYNYRLDALYHFMPEQQFVPFIAAGIGGIRNEFPTATGIQYKATPAFNYGVGAKYYLTENVALRADVRHLIMHPDWTMHNVEYTAGLSFAFGGAKPAPAPAPAPVVEPAPAPKPVVLDTDGDGVLDPMDKCPGTPQRVKVDVNGCPVDTDGDGVADYLDKCPGTPQGVQVDRNGCPVDTDGDGVADYLDKCPGTPQGVKVDVNGCPVDTDGDGIADYLDKCPGTPQGVQVDSTGCPIDSDGDGVPDYLDKCPDTPKGTSVNKDGCPPPVEKLCIVLEVEFDTNKADIKAKYHGEMKKVGDFLNEYPTATGVINGYTDNVGKAAYNLKLSQKRADSVRKYILDKFGIAPERLSAKGHGMTNPVAANTTAAGRQKNRRINATFDCVVKK